MSQIPIENDDTRSVAASDFVQLDQPDEVPDQQEDQQQGQLQFGLDQSFWTLESGSTHNKYENGFKEMKWMMANLQAQNQTLQATVKNLELEAKIRAMEENAEQNTKYQALETKMNEVTQMLSTQNEEHHKEMAQLKDGFAKQMAQLEAKNRKLKEKLMSNLEGQTTKNGALDAKMAQLQDGFSKKLVEQQKQLKTQFQAQFHSLEQKLKKAEQPRRPPIPN